MTPLFSVLLPTKNRLTYLRYAVESVRRQDYPNWEIIISDNCSQDDIAGYVQGLGDERIIHVRTHQPLDVTANWNNALDRCRGDYLIMLGDDDGLTPGYFTSMLAHLQAQQPDLIFSSALIYAYPQVIPGFPAGFLKQDASPIFQVAAPFILPAVQAHALVAASMRFTMAFPFNMQYSLVSRSLVNRLKSIGAFYQSPYPDYYATNALFLAATRILVDPVPRVIIGVSPKSYGFYHFNNKEEEGALFLDNAPGQVEADRLRHVLLPGTTSASAWLLAMEQLKRGFPELHLEVDYKRYRRMQMATIYKRYHLEGQIDRLRFRDLMRTLSWRERWLAGMPLAVALRASRLFGRRSYRWLLDAIRRCTGFSHAGALDLRGDPQYATTCTTLLEVFERGMPVAPQPQQAIPVRS